jgi:hypothetical protein
LRGKAHAPKTVFRLIAPVPWGSLWQKRHDRDPCWVSMPIAAGPSGLIVLRSEGPRGAAKSRAKARGLRYHFGAACNVINRSHSLPEWPLYPLKADMCVATSDVRYGPKADIFKLARIPKFSHENAGSSSAIGVIARNAAPRCGGKKGDVAELSQL